MASWKCERCGYTHLTQSPSRIPSRCPVCKSTRLRVISSEITAADPSQHPTPEQTYGRIGLLRKLPVQEGEQLRRDMVRDGIHVLSLVPEEPLSSVLPKKEAEYYLELVKRHGYGLAVVDGAVMAVSPSSPIRLHLGVSEPLVKELEKAAGKED